MRTVSGSTATAASNDAATDGRETFLTIGSGNILPPDQWFMHIAHSLWGNGENSPAKWLRYFTGFPERTCRSAAAGDTEVSSAMLYVLLRGDAGEAVFEKIMVDAPSDWFRKLQRAKRIAAAIDGVR